MNTTNMAHPPFPAAGPWANYPRFKFAELIERFPELTPLPNYEEVEIDELLDWAGRMECLLVEGDVFVSAAQLAELEALNFALVVDGNLEVEGKLVYTAYVNGNIFCDTWTSISLSSRLVAYRPETEFTARQYLLLSAEDHESIQISPALKLKTPYLFSWFYRVDTLSLEEHTAIFIMTDDVDCNNPELPNPVFPWQDSIYVLDEPYVDTIENSDADVPPWNFTQIERALAKGKSIFMDGFDPLCMPDKKEGDAAFKCEHYEQAYHHYKACAQRSPKFYLAWLGMGECLFSVGAYQQALDNYQEASRCFPHKQTRLLNQGLENGALSALRLGQYELARELSGQCISANTFEQYQKDKQAFRAEMFGREMGEARLNDELALAYRVRAEAHWILGDRVSAKADLAQSLARNPWLGSANWLMGLFFHEEGKIKEAASYQKKAIERHASFAADYTQHKSTNSFAPIPTRVDWD